MATRAATKTPAQVFALVFGVVYLLVGVVGFFVTGFENFASNTEKELIIFALNPLHNIVHILIGVVWIGAASKHDSAKGVNMLFGVVLGLVAALGFAGALGWLAIDGAGEPDNFLHLTTAVLAIYFGSAGATTGQPVAA
ncbi:MAG: DUF4383 domain-containing protein [Actinomycetota bacterium]